MAECPKCKMPVASNVSECIWCSAPVDRVSEIVTPNRTYCSKCGVSLSSASAICPYCFPEASEAAGGGEKEKAEAAPIPLWPAIVFQLALLIPWATFAALGGMAYTGGHLFPGIVAVGPLHAYPVILVVCAIRASALKEQGKYRSAEKVAWLPMAISGGGTAIGFVIVYLFNL